MTTPTTAKRIWTRDEIVNLLETNPGFLHRAMIKLYERQTRDEQRARTTMVDNKRGFSAFHAKTGTKLGKYAKEGGTFGWKWRGQALKVAKIHVGQLVAIANGEE